RLPTRHAGGPPNSRGDGLDLGQLRPASGGYLGGVQAEGHGWRARLPRAERLHRGEATFHRWHRPLDEGAVWPGDQGVEPSTGARDSTAPLPPTGGEGRVG